MQLLPLAAQGLWMRMLCWMHRNEAHRGFLELPTGAPMLDSDISRKVGQNVKEIRRAIASMERIGVFDRDDRGCIMNRRMVRDTHISEVRRSAAMKRASVVDRAKHGEFAPAKPPAKPEQTPTVTASAPDSVPVPVKTTTSAAVELPRELPPPTVHEMKNKLARMAQTNALKTSNGSSATKAILDREIQIRLFAQHALETYPGAERLPGSPDAVVIGQCVDLCRGYPISEEQALKQALIAMARARKMPASSWMWFPTVMKQYLEKRA